MNRPNNMSGREYTSPMIEFYHVVPESSIMVTSTFGNAENYEINEVNDLWM